MAATETHTAPDEPIAPVAHFTVAEREAAAGPRGRRCRAVARRVGAGIRPADPVELLEEQAQTRVPELVPIRYGRMLASPFTFFRGGRT